MLGGLVTGLPGVTHILSTATFVDTAQVTQVSTHGGVQPALHHHCSAIPSCAFVFEALNQGLLQRKVFHFNEAQFIHFSFCRSGLGLDLEDFSPMLFQVL